MVCAKVTREEQRKVEVINPFKKSFNFCVINNDFDFLCKQENFLVTEYTFWYLLSTFEVLN